MISYQFKEAAERLVNSSPSFRVKTERLLRNKGRSLGCMFDVDMGMCDLLDLMGHLETILYGFICIEIC